MTFRFSSFSQTLAFTCLSIVVLLVFHPAIQAQQSKLDTAMKIKPKHFNEVEIENPGVAVLKDCKFEQTKSPSGFIVHHASGRILRRFIDTNGDGKLDQWSYYKDGLEVYRDVDANKDGKLDQYRWMGTAGTRWGLDRDQNGEIDSWKVISPEEIAYECFQAIKSNSQERFNRLLLSEAELKSLGLSEKINSVITARWQRARREFASLVRTQKVINRDSKWVYAGNGQPAMMASGDGNQKDLIVYDHASGFFQNGDDTRQIALGSIVRINDSWRMVELPEIVDPQKPLSNGGGFFPIAEYGSGRKITEAVDKELAKMFADLAKLEESIEKASGSAEEKLQKQKADTLVQIYTRTKEPKNKIDWIQNLADSVASAYQADKFQNGVDYLNGFILKNKSAPGIDYVKWRAIFAEYGWFTKNADDKRKDAAREKLMLELAAFCKTYPKSEFAPDAHVQLAVDAEVTSTDEPEKALEWYKQCASKYPDTDFGRRSQGAIVRLSSYGRAFPFQSKTSSGRDFNLTSVKGKIVVLHYWETWCLQKDEIELLDKIAKKFKDDVVIIGCNIESGDGATQSFNQFVKANSKNMAWPQLHEPGGVDGSPLAHQLGVALEPLIVLVDREGKLVESNISIGDLEREIERERRRR
ncbi:MAG: redoxin domain-containing protein [Planctomycetota bacterium]